MMKRLQSSEAVWRHSSGPPGRAALSLIVLAVVLASGATELALAAADGLAERIAACTREHDDVRRLACFDRAAATLPRTAENAVTGKVDPIRSFGIQGSELARNRQATDSQENAPPQRMTAKVAALDKRPRGELVFTLDNGQVWAQKEAGAYLPVKVGDSVTILAGSLGSFRLAAGNRVTAVTRVR